MTRSVRRGRWPPAGTRRLLALLVVGPALAAACGDDAAVEVARRDAEIDAARQAGDHARALHLARSLLEEQGDRTETMLAAAAACIGLERYDDAVDWAERALALARTEGAGADLLADVHWALGKALMGRYRGLRSSDDWRRANSALETAAGAGSHRLEAAYMLMLLQRMSDLGSPSRMQRFAEQVIRLAPPGDDKATAARALLERPTEGG